jgi:hypothetical protein
MRSAIGCLLALALGLCGGPALATSKTKKQPTACQKLAKRYKDRSPDRKLVLVERGSDETGRISACVLPRGKVRTLTSWDDGLARDAAAIVATAGTWVVVEDTHGDQYGGVSRAVTRVDVRGGRRLLLSSYGCLLDFSQPSCPDGTNAGKLAIAPSGAGAYEVSDFASHATTLRGFSPQGIFATLADGPVEALRVTTTQVFWTQAGVEHQAPLLP